MAFEHLGGRVPEQLGHRQGVVPFVEHVRRESVTVAVRHRALRQAQLEAEVDDLTRALGEAAVELRVWKKSAEGRLGPLRTSR